MLFARTPEPSFADRLISAQLLSTDAKTAFIEAAEDLETTGDELDILAQDTQNEIDRLTGIRQAAIEDSDKSRAIARNLRALVNPDLTLF